MNPLKPLVVLGLYATAVRQGAYTFTSIVPCIGCNAAAFGINNAGQIAGAAFNAAGGHGFFGRFSRFTNFDAPGSILTEATSLNDYGTVSGDALRVDGRTLARVVSITETQQKAKKRRG